MSDFVAESARPEADHAAMGLGQRHDRIPGGDSGDHDSDGIDVEITAAQKMLSAVSGSLLTALLGEL